ncbi:DNA polymerase IV [Halomonas elongata]|uniref:DNA polymerase IV n=1 Tax=Halomonas elongata (strain ATCC 33173 / DSM 2581 / NBRC 15536 / NCIMB 2198 / 1H9) TaxID=768066 RepID=E1V428_HALED|nr:DNA polymerase IV [Halomonas elongata]MBW5799688.1 DNA polymerase IV [Halomonas elongata]RAW06581.1 DNA polymerase IV [Halomonas elongata]WBF16602.1 DNA polymerase IV [Halomonas elongata]WPU49043.1 DNA polymerase IV [Halomonas elongata DSM 2581]WVI70277.1 DNA polymerase IV [Halomonas elongata]
MRKILHADCDCFYAAVEMRDNPALRDIPLAIGGTREQRGVIATCNYPARAYGIHSAMPTARALRLCPHLTLLPGDFDKYRAVSRQLQDIFHELTPVIEPLSLDEAFLDVTDVENFQGSATWMAQWLKRECLARTGITVSVGVAPAKFLAKIASDWEKPDGLTVIPPEQVDTFVATLPVHKLHGVGPATAARLEALGIATCSDLRRLPFERLIDEFGKFGRRLFELARGIDERPVRTERERKSISVETTFEQDLPDLSSAQQALAPLCERLKERLARYGQPPLAGLFVKVRFDDFSLTTLESRGLPAAPESFSQLLEQAWSRAHRPVRLLGVGARLIPEEARQQLPLPL